MIIMGFICLSWAGGWVLCSPVFVWSVVNVLISEGLSNVEFYCGKAEDVFPTTLSSLVSPNITAIVDPPRAGLRE